MLFANLKSLRRFGERRETQFSQSADNAVGWKEANHFESETLGELPVVLLQIGEDINQVGKAVFGIATL